MSLATIISWYIKAQNKKIKKKITKDTSPNIPAIFDIFWHFNHNWRTQQQRQNCIREAHLTLDRSYARKAFVKWRAMLTMQRPQHIAKLFQMLRHLMRPSNQYTSHMKCPTLSQPIQAHCKQSSWSITLVIPKGIQFFRQNTSAGFEPQTCKGKIKSTPLAAPCYFIGEDCNQPVAKLALHFVPGAISLPLNNVDMFLTDYLA